MKMQPNRYTELKTAIEKVIEFAGGKNIVKSMYLALSTKRMMWDMLQVVIRNWAYDDNHPAFAQGHWTRVLPHNGTNYSTFYNEGLNDNHINTALNKIAKELKLL